MLEDNVTSTKTPSQEETNQGIYQKTAKKESTKWTFPIRFDCDTKEKEPKTRREDTPEANKPMHSLLPQRIPVLPFGAFNIDKKRSRV